VRVDFFGLDEHHYVTGPIRGPCNPDLSDDARKVFWKETTGDVGRHDYSKPHPEYNKAVKENWDKWIKGKDQSKLSEDQAKKFVDLIKNSKDPRIKNYLDKLHDIAKERAEKKLARTGAKRIVKKIPVVGIGFFLIDWSDDGLGYAISEAIWWVPVTECE
jgi:hypothetical protein